MSTPLYVKMFSMEKVTWISFGETCSSQLFINYNQDKIKTAFTVYTWTACNIDYALHFEENGYDDLTKKENFIAQDFLNPEGDKNFYPIKYQSGRCADSLNNYDERTRSFILWHNNILESEMEWGKWCYRASRMNSLRDEEPLVLLYYNDFPNRDRLPHVRESLIKLRDNYYPHAQVVLFYYNIDESSRELRRVFETEGLLEFEIRVPQNQFAVGGEPVQDFYAEMIEATHQALSI